VGEQAAAAKTQTARFVREVEMAEHNLVVMLR
jgi:hypothetical protein